MSKEKTLKNNPVGTVRYWWGWALFSRQFEMEVNVPPIRIAEHLGKVRQPMQGLIEPSGRTTTIREIEPDGIYEFEMLLKRRWRGQDHTRARASGRIVYSEGYQTSIIRGDVRLTASNLFTHLVVCVIFLMAMLFAFSSGLPDLYMPVIVLGLFTLLFTSGQIFADYYELQAVLLYQLEQAHAEQPAADRHAPGNVLAHEPYPIVQSQAVKTKGKHEE